MKVIILQGMPCLGKTGLCNLLAETLDNCKVFSVDTYGEDLWDKHGFDSTKERNWLYALGVEYMFKDIEDTTTEHNADYIIIEGVFNEKRVKYLDRYTSSCDCEIRTIFMYTVDVEKHKEVWEVRSRNFKRRHPGHGATHYHNGEGCLYTNKYYGTGHNGMKTWGDVLNIEVWFNEYKRSVTDEDILKFVLN